MGITPESLQRTLGSLLVSLLILGAGACSTTRQTRSVATHGFLGDYAQLRPGVGDQALLVYIDPDVNWKQYDSILLESVTIWHDSETAGISAEDQQRLTDLLYGDLRDTLSQDYKLVERPGPGVLRMRAAITEAKEARVVGNTLTTIVPQARLASTLLGLATDTQVWVGKAAVEAEIQDSMTGERLMAAVDERAGAKTLRGLGGQWKDVDEAFQYWAERVRKRLEMLRGA